MGYMDVNDYYFAVHLDQMKQWFQPPSTLLCTVIEHVLISTCDFPTLLLADLWHPTNIGDLPPPVQVFLLAS